MEVLQILAEGQTKLVRGLIALGHGPEGAQQSVPVVKTKFNIGIAHINGQQHNKASLGRQFRVRTEQVTQPRWVVISP